MEKFSKVQKCNKQEEEFFKRQPKKGGIIREKGEKKVKIALLYCLFSYFERKQNRKDKPEWGENVKVALFCCLFPYFVTFHSSIFFTPYITIHNYTLCK